MTREEFELKEKEWQKRLEDLVVEMGSFSNHKEFKVLINITPPVNWYNEAIDLMYHSFDTDEAILISMPYAGDNDE